MAYIPTHVLKPTSITQGALLKGVKLFNEEMLARWRTEGFLDFASSNTSRSAPTSLGSVLRYAPRQGHAVEMLQAMLAFDKDAVEAQNIEQARGRRGVTQHPGEERVGGEEAEAAPPNPGARETVIPQM